jgi:hypothetical protein
LGNINNFDLIDQTLQSNVTSTIEGHIFAGYTDQPVLKITTETFGSKNPLDLTHLQLGKGVSNASLINNVKVYYTGNNDVFDMSNLFGSDSNIISQHFEIFGSQKLYHGKNYFWVTYDVSEAAQYGDTLDASCDQIELRNNIVIPTITNPIGINPIGKLYTFDTVANQGFYSRSNNTEKLTWYRGKPSVGPASAYSGDTCWIARIPFNNVVGYDFSLYSKPYVATSTVANVAYQQWYDFIDGSNNGTNSRNLSINYTGTSVAIWISPLNSIVIKNTNITGNGTASRAGIYYGNLNDALITSYPGASLNNSSFENNAIGNFNYGIHVSGVNQTTLNMNNKYINNHIGDSNKVIGTAGLSTLYSQFDTISKNVIRNVSFNDFNNYIPAAGILANKVTNMVIEANKVYDIIAASGSASSTSGIHLESLPQQSGTNNVVVNNFVARVSCPSFASLSISGIRLVNGSHDKIYYNTVNLTGSNIVTIGEAVAFYLEGNTSRNVDIKNNIFYVNGASTGTIFLEAGGMSIPNTMSALNSTSDYNNIYCLMSGVGPSYNVKGASNYNSLAAWRTASGQDLNSKSSLVTFVSDIDLRLTGSSIGNASALLELQLLDLQQILMVTHDMPLHHILVLMSHQLRFLLHWFRLQLLLIITMLMLNGPQLLRLTTKGFILSDRLMV